ncbi:MAG: hypothetical protein PPHERAN_6348 [uncultured Paraburkholderia sp.]|nr:MAG: hypothetical protein PPHERAN_6348 [uncultured Paraburkholderia sp.]
MEYTPEQVHGIAEVSAVAALDLSAPAVIRRLRVSQAKRRNGLLLLITPDIALPLAIPLSQVMTFGTEAITAFDYFDRVIEQGDMVDAVLSPACGGIFPVRMYWIHIEYVGSLSEAGAFRKKEDGLFAMRTKAGEKAERIVARKLKVISGIRSPIPCSIRRAFSKSTTQTKKIASQIASAVGVV